MYRRFAQKDARTVALCFALLPYAIVSFLLFYELTPVIGFQMFWTKWPLTYYQMFDYAELLVDQRYTNTDIDSVIVAMCASLAIIALRN